MDHYKTFISKFKGRLTFQLFPEHGTGRPYHFTKSASEACTDLVQKNKEGMGAFLMINEGDGRGRKSAHVKTIRAVFADLDNVSLQHAYDQLSKNDQGKPNLHPHMIINTSPDKYHLYWFVDDFPIDKFKQVQQAIALKIGSDKSVCDLGRVMRVAGFYHKKGTPHPVKITNIIEGDNYSYEQIIKEFPLIEKKKPIFRRKIMQAVTGGVDFSKLDVVTWFNSHGLYDGYIEDNIHSVTCPWIGEHSSKSNAETIIFQSKTGRDWVGFHCKHNSCQGRNIQQVAALLGDAKEFC